MNERIVECRKAFEEWALYEMGFQWQGCCNGDYFGEEWKAAWDCWRAAWESRQEQFDEMEDAMIAMSDSLGTVANS